MNRTVPEKIQAIILAGGKGSRLWDLTESIAKPALPIGPSARLIDYTLANVAHSRIPGAFALTQYASHSLATHLDAMKTPLRDLHGLDLEVFDGADYGSFAGTADAVRKVTDRIDETGAEQVVILAGDHLYQMDYRPFVAAHREHRAQATIGAVHVPLHQAREFGIITADARGRVVAFDEKPREARPCLDAPGCVLASMGIYVFDWPFLRALLARLARTEPDLDFGKHVIPALVETDGVYAYALPSRGQSGPLWRDLGTLDAYHGVHTELASGSLSLDPDWAIPGIPSPPPAPGALMRNWSANAGKSETHIGPRSRLTNVVVLPGARIGSDVVLRDALVTGEAVIPDGFDLDRVLEQATGWCTVSEQGIRILSGRAMTALGRLVSFTRTAA